MPAPNNTFLSTSAVGNRQELSDVVDITDTWEVPIYSWLNKGKCVSTNPTWEKDVIRAAGENIKAEGSDYEFNATTPPVKVGNHTQIMSDSWIVSNTQEVVDNAGQYERTKQAKLNVGLALKKDVELAIVTNNASVGGATREFGGLPTWLETNVSRGSGGTNGGYSSGTGLTVAAGAGTQRAMTKTLIDGVLQSGAASGAKLRDIFGSLYLKSVFVTIMSDSAVAPFRYSVTDGKNNTMIANADYYEGPHGRVMFHPNPQMSLAAGVARNLFFLDKEKVEFLWLRKLANDPNLAKTGDNSKGVIIGEGTLKVVNERGLGVLADLYGLTSGS